jgi:class 3 adenylate cyclase
METLALGGQKVTLTIMATDLRGFTAMSENLSPEEVVAQLNAYHGVMTRCPAQRRKIPGFPQPDTTWMLVSASLHRGP